MMISQSTDPSPSDRQSAGGLSRENIQTIVPLLPKQHAMLLARDLDGADPGFLHVRCLVRGALDLGLFRRAWESVAIWHAGLRMSVHSRDDGDPLAVVRRQLEISLDANDWRDRPAITREAEIEAWLRADTDRGLDLELPSIGRLALLQIDASSYELVWTCHHLFLDGWSASIVLDDVVRVYNAAALGLDPPEPPAPLAFRTYRRWLDARSRTEDQRYWLESFRGYSGAGRLRGSGGGRAADDTVEVTTELDPGLPRRAASACAAWRVTPSVLLHAAWSLTLSCLLETDDVCFGTVVSGRTAPVDGIDRLVGDCSNMVAVRAPVVPDASVSAWIRGLHESQLARQHHEHAALADVHEWTGVPGRVPLFDSLLVIENFPTNASPAVDGGVTISDFRSGLTSNLPVTFAIILGSEWRLRARFSTTDCESSAAGEMVRCFLRSLAVLLDAQDEPVGVVRDRIEIGSLRSLLPEREDTPAHDETGTPHGYVPPRDEIERRLAGIWERVLGLNAIGVRDSFFSLGGTSINAVRVFARIEEVFDRRLAVSTLLRHPTIESLASLLRGDDLDERGTRCLVPIQAGGTKPPIACVHAGGAHVLFYRFLAARLGTDQPVLGLEPVGLNGAEPPLESIPEMAARYVEELREASPEGPYRLVGYCIGGCVCLEMARVLESQGQRVELLAIIDSGLPWAGARVVSPGARARRKLLKRGVVALGRAAIKHARERVRRRLELRVGTGDARGRVHQQLVEEACKRAFGKYYPQRCEAPILLVRSSEYAQLEEKMRHFKWEAYTSRLEVRVVEAEHATILMEPSVGRVAHAIEQTLGRVSHEDEDCTI